MSAPVASGLGGRIAVRRRQLGLSQQALADRIGEGADFSMVSKWERGVYAPSLERLADLARALETVPDDLIGAAPATVERPADPAVPFHPVADLFPMMAPAEFEALVADMYANGFRAGQEIVLFEGQILDGRNRYLAAVEAGLIDADVAAYTPSGLTLTSEYFREFGSEAGERGATDAALAYVVAHNLNRRHLTVSQRAMIAAEIARLPAHRPVRNQEARSGEAATGKQHEARSGEAATGSEANPARSGEAAAGNEISHPTPPNPVTPPDGGVTTAEAARDLGVGARTVERARRVAETAAPELAGAVRAGGVTLAQAETLADLPADEQRRLIETADKKVLAAAARDLRAKRQADKAARRAAREAELAASTAALPQARYNVIYADPEWRFEPYSRASGMDRAADNHYPTSDLASIKARPVADIAADDCALFLWATAPMLPQALEVMAAWGFAYKTHVVWHKRRRGRGRGTGYWFTGEHELLLLGTRGAPPAPVPGGQGPSLIEAPIGLHSEKPDVFADMIETYFPNLPKIELNARAARPGWDVWGQEAGSGIAATGNETNRAASDATERSA